MIVFDNTIKREDRMAFLSKRPSWPLPISF
jgi:hypothetical protein